jgi:hypothetical protein
MKSKKSKAGKRLKYNMRGCSKKMRKNYLGGQNTPYPSTGPPPNPYTVLGTKYQSGGSCLSCQSGGTNTFIGSPWSSSNWPSSNNANHYSLNTYTPVDIQLQTKVLGANPPFSKGGRRMRKSKKRRNRTLQKGGNLSNSLFQDLANFGRGLSYSAGSTYNTLMGVPAPVSPLPWQGQFSGTTGNKI